MKRHLQNLRYWLIRRLSRGQPILLNSSFSLNDLEGVDCHFGNLLIMPGNHLIKISGNRSKSCTLAGTVYTIGKME